MAPSHSPEHSRHFDSRVPVLTHPGFPSMSQRFPRAPFTTFGIAGGDGDLHGETRTRLSGLRDELTQLINDDDECWYAFGFSKPSDPDTPEDPENVVVNPGAPGSHLPFIDWDDA